MIEKMINILFIILGLLFFILGGVIFVNQDEDGTGRIMGGMMGVMAVLLVLVGALCDFSQVTGW